MNVIDGEIPEYGTRFIAYGNLSDVDAHGSRLCPPLRPRQAIVWNHTTEQTVGSRRAGTLYLGPGLRIFRDARGALHRLRPGGGPERVRVGPFVYKIDAQDRSLSLGGVACERVADVSLPPTGPPPLPRPDPNWPVLSHPRLHFPE